MAHRFGLPVRGLASRVRTVIAGERAEGDQDADRQTGMCNRAKPTSERERERERERETERDVSLSLVWLDYTHGRKEGRKEDYASVARHIAHSPLAVIVVARNNETWWAGV